MVFKLKFEDMKLSKDIVNSLNAINIYEPTDVQIESIPRIAAGKDVIVRAKTGTGKTLAVLIPIIQKIKESKGHGNIRLLILAPTRELALQISGVAMKLVNRDRVITVYGGSSISVQMRALRSGADIVIGTPGRTIDLIERKALIIDAVEYFVIDEADIMMDMGFIEDVEYILDLTPTTKQTVILSATIPREIIDLSQKRLKKPEFISVGKSEEVTVKKIKHVYGTAAGTKKFHLLLAYIEKYNPEKAIIFLQTKRESDILHNFLVKQGFDAILMHGGLTQAKRMKSLSRFRKNARFLIATNVAARGLDIAGISDIINFDIPDNPNVYVHRVGRTARMGKDGRAFSIVSREQIGIIKDIEYEANIKMEKIFLETRDYEQIAVDFHLRRTTVGRFGGTQHSTGRDTGRDTGRGRERSDKRSSGYGEKRSYGTRPTGRFNSSRSSDDRSRGHPKGKFGSRSNRKFDKKFGKKRNEHHY